MPLSVSINTDVSPLNLLTVSFDDWWEQKRHLFELPKIESGNTNNDDYLVVSIPVM